MAATMRNFLISLEKHNNTAAEYHNGWPEPLLLPHSLVLSKLHSNSSSTHQGTAPPKQSRLQTDDSTEGTASHPRGTRQPPNRPEKKKTKKPYSLREVQTQGSWVYEVRSDKTPQKPPFEHKQRLRCETRREKMRGTPTKRARSGPVWKLSEQQPSLGEWRSPKIAVYNFTRHAVVACSVRLLVVKL